MHDPVQLGVDHVVFPFGANIVALLSAFLAATRVYHEVSAGGRDIEHCNGPASNNSAVRALELDHVNRAVAWDDKNIRVDPLSTKRVPVEIVHWLVMFSAGITDMKEKQTSPSCRTGWAGVLYGGRRVLYGPGRGRIGMERWDFLDIGLVV